MTHLSLSLLLSVAAGLCRGQLGISPQDMQNAVNTLSERFTTIRNEGLGVDLLEDTLRVTPFVSTELSDQNITDLLEEDTLQAAVNAVVGLFDSVVTAAAESSLPAASQEECCATDGTSSTDTVCTYPAPSSTVNQNILNVFTSGSLSGRTEIMFGGVDGSLIRSSSNPLPDADACQQRDSRLMPWFANGARGNANPLEVVLLVDTVAFGGSEVTEERVLVRQAASLVLGSLTTADKVGLVALDNPSRVPSVITRNRGVGETNRVVPVCTDTIFELDSFVSSFTPQGDTSGFNIEYTDAFQMALSLFSTTTDADQLFLFLTTGTSSRIRSETTNVEGVISNFPAVNFAVYRADDDTLDFFDGIPSNGAEPINLDSGDVAHLIGGYYSNIVTDNPPPNSSVNITYGHANPGADVGNSLTMRRAVFSGSDFVGVLYAVIPFSESISTLLATTTSRDYSYAFVVDDNQNPLFHPLLPGDLTAGEPEVAISDLEPEGVVMQALDSSTPQPVTKTHLTYTGTTDYHSFAYRSVPSNYFCRTSAVPNTELTVCYVLAEEERMLRTVDFDQVVVADVYSQRQPPVYHNLALSVDDQDFCNYFCKPSLTTEVSYQLTTPNRPDMNDSRELVDDLTGYIEGRGGADAPSFVSSQGFAEEAALAMSVSEAWLEETNSSDYITRRHLATPNGLYLTFPPTHLISEFTPTVTEWYQSPSAHPSLLTLSPPHLDPLIEGSKLTVSLGFAVRPPSSETDDDLGDEGPPFAVISGDLTVNSMHVFVREALPQCENEDTECIIVDDSGNLVYEEELENFNGEASFFGRSLSRLRIIVSNLTGLTTKRQCTELFNIQLGSRRFHNLDTSNEELMVNPPNHCAQYMVQHIPNTNTFLMVYEDNQCERVLCFCTEECVNCDDFNTALCECPCNCSANACELPSGLPVCPRVFNQDSNYDRVISEQFNTNDETPFCFDQQCSCRTDFDSCFGVRECHWCEEQQKCAQLTECCDLDQEPQCCVSAEEEARFSVFLPTCSVFGVLCFRHPHPVINETCARPEPTTLMPTPSPSNTSTIIAAVVGALVGVLLILLIILLLVYYRFCRKVDPAEESSRESAFDFSNKTAMTGVNSKSNSSSKGGKGSSKTNSEADVEKGTAEENEIKEKTPPKDPPKEESTL